MTLSYLKTSFSCVPTKTISWRFQETSLWGPFSKICVFGSRKFRLRVDEGPKRKKKSPFSRKYQDRCARDLNSLRSKCFRAVSRVKCRAKNDLFPSPLFHFWLSFHFSRGQNRGSRSSVFPCSETARKRLLRRLGP